MYQTLKFFLNIFPTGDHRRQISRHWFAKFLMQKNRLAFIRWVVFKEKSTSHGHFIRWIIRLNIFLQNYGRTLIPTHLTSSDIHWKYTVYTNDGYSVERSTLLYVRILRVCLERLKLVEKLRKKKRGGKAYNLLKINGEKKIQVFFK